MGLKRMYLFLCMCITVSFAQTLWGGTIGSVTTSSKQLKTFFPASDTNNKMYGFTAFEKGLTLEDSTTTCIFDAYFPVSGPITLSGGTLYLYRDAVFRNPLSIGTGTIDGRAFSLEFPSNILNFYLPTQNHGKVLNYITEVSIGDNVNAISWSHDDAYIAVVCDSFGGNELKVYSFDGQEFTWESFYNFGSYSAYTVDWHPSEYYLAVGQQGGDELYTFSYNASTESLEQKDTANVGRVYATKWSPSGDKLAVSRYNNNDVLVYAVENGMLSTMYTCTLYQDTSEVKTISSQIRGLAWHSSGQYLAVSFKMVNWWNSATYGIKIFKWDGSGFVDDAILEVSDYLYPIAWRPNSSYITAGFYSSSERFRLYEHDQSAKTLTEVTDAQLAESRNVYDIAWDVSGTCASYVKKKGNSNYELEVYTFDDEADEFNLVSGYNHSNDLKALAWSHDGNYIAAGGTGDKMVALGFDQRPLRFKNIRVFCKSDVVLTGEIVFDGSCILNMGRNILEFDTDGCITVTNGAQLVIEDARIKGITNNKITCLDDDGVVTLRDVAWIQDGNYNFTQGAMIWQNDVLMAGDYTFAYQTIKTSTLASKSTLELDVNFTFSYNPNCNAQNLIQLTDNSSLLLLNGATLHTTVTGLQLTDGKLRVLRDSFLSSEKTVELAGGLVEVTIDNGITFGNGDASHDLICDIFSGVTLHVLEGSLHYKNISSSSWSMTNFTSVLYLYANTQLNIYQNLNLGDGSLLLGNNAVIGRALGKSITGAIRPQGTLLYTNI